MQVQPLERQPRACGIQQFEARDMQVGWHRAGEACNAEGAAAMGIRERDDFALAGCRVDGGDDAAAEHDDEEQYRADGDAEPLGDLSKPAHQNACPMPI